MTDYVRELRSLELALRQAEEHGFEDTAKSIRGQIPGAVATCRRELTRLEGNPPNYGSAAYAQDVDEAARLREALARYDDPDPDPEPKPEPKSARRGRSPKETTADKTPKETT